LVKYPNTTSSWYAAKALGELGDISALPALEKAIENGSEPLLENFKMKDIAELAINRIKLRHKVSTQKSIISVPPNS
jgi:HEAT repeat protein